MKKKSHMIRKTNKKMMGGNKNLNLRPKIQIKRINRE